MDDDWIPCRAALGGKNALDGRGFESVGAKAVDGLCGKGHKAAGTENSRYAIKRLGRLGGIEAVGIDKQPKRLHSSIVAGGGHSFFVRRKRSARWYGYHQRTDLQSGQDSRVICPAPLFANQSFAIL